MRFDLEFRPGSYLDPRLVLPGALSRIRGERRRRLVREALEGVSFDDQQVIADVLAELGPLSAEVHHGLEKIAPWFAGGEYLPPLAWQEVEIARIVQFHDVIEVVSVRARPATLGYQYRVVDEYNLSYLPGITASLGTLTLGLLVELIDNMETEWHQSGDFVASLRDYRLAIVRHWSAHDVARLAGLVRVTSEFYPDLERLYDARACDWAGERTLFAR